MKKRLFLCLFCLFSGSLSVIAQDAWTQLNDFPFEAFTSGSFVVGEDAYVTVRETLSSSDSPSAVHEYDFEADTWTFVATIPDNIPFLEDPFVINDRVFFLGLAPNAEGMIELWEFDRITSTFEQRANYDFGGFGFNGYSATSFAIGGMGYVLTSAPADETEGVNFIAYDPVTDTWTEKANFLGYNEGYNTSFATSTKGYILFGFKDLEGYTNDLWEYDPEIDIWTQKTAFPTNFLIGSTSLVINDEIYVGSGWYDDTVILYDFYRRYNPTTDTWDLVEASPFLSGNPFGFVMNGIGYVGLGNTDIELTGGDPSNEIWRLDPELLSVTEVNPEALSLYPNPVTDIVFIQSTTPIQEITVYSVLGQAVLTERIQNNQLDVSSLSKGMYLLELRNGAGVVTQRLVKD